MLQETNTKFRTDLRNLISQEPCSIASELVRPYQSYKAELEGFITDKFHQEHANVDVSKVVGSNHPDYQDKPWSYLILHGKRSDTNLKKLAKSPEYYLAQLPENDRPNFVKIEDEIFIVCGGNNRTIIAKFFFHYNRDKITESLLRNVPLTEYRVDWHSLDVKREIESILDHPRFAHLSLTLVTDSFATNTSDKYRWHLFNNKIEGDDQSIKLTRNELPVLRDDLKSDSLLKRIFGIGYSKNLRTHIFF